MAGSHPLPAERHRQHPGCRCLIEAVAAPGDVLVGAHQKHIGGVDAACVVVGDANDLERDTPCSRCPFGGRAVDITERQQAEPAVELCIDGAAILQKKARQACAGDGIANISVRVVRHLCARFGGDDRRFALSARQSA